MISSKVIACFIVMGGVNSNLLLASKDGAEVVDACVRESIANGVVVKSYCDEEQAYIEFKCYKF
jgi:hypothetical protein